MDDQKVKKHPDKTFIGRYERGFDFLGYRFAPAGLGVARATVERFIERVSRLYDRGATASRIDRYIGNWLRWVRGGVNQRVVLNLAVTVRSFAVLTMGALAFRFLFLIPALQYLCSGCHS